MIKLLGDVEYNRVFGHTCEGLQGHHRKRGGSEEYDPDGRVYNCVPYISAEGFLVGCDAENEATINFCPWCGARVSNADLPF